MLSEKRSVQIGSAFGQRDDGLPDVWEMAGPVGRDVKQASLTVDSLAHSPGILRKEPIQGRYVAAANSLCCFVLHLADDSASETAFYFAGFFFGAPKGETSRRGNDSHGLREIDLRSALG